MAIAANQVIQSRNNQFVIAPTTMTEAMDYAKMICTSCFCPKDMKGKAGDVLVAMQMGAEVGLSPLQALQNIAVINGRPCIWGDAALALVIASPNYANHREWFEGSIKDGNRTAFCGITRKGSEEHVISFGMDDAKKANLWSKSGVWQNYPDRMLQMRARAFAMRDKFADALRGLNFREEVEDYQVPATASNVRTATIVPRETLLVEQSVESVSNDLEQIYKTRSAKIASCAEMDELKECFDAIKKIDFSARPDLFKKLIEEKDQKKSVIEFNSEWDGAEEKENVE
jgi:hypothetical protein